MTNVIYGSLAAQHVIDNLTQGAGGEGQMEAVRNVSDLLHGHMSAEQFDNILDVIRNAQANSETGTLSPRRQAFNESYLKTVQTMTNLSFAGVEA